MCIFILVLVGCCYVVCVGFVNADIQFGLFFWQVCFPCFRDLGWVSLACNSLFYVVLVKYHTERNYLNYNLRL